MFKPVFVIEAAPLGEYISTYCSYVSGEGFNNSNLYTPGGTNPNPPELIAASLQVGSACELVLQGEEVTADQQLDVTDDNLAGFIEDAAQPRVPLSAVKAATSLKNMAAVIRARKDPQALRNAYTVMRTGLVQDARRFRNQEQRLRRLHQEHPYDEEIYQSLGDYSGLFVERVGGAALTGIDSVFAMPALIQHDDPKDCGKGHDLVLIAKESTPSEAEEMFITRKVQIKRACLELCPADDRGSEQGKDASKYRNRYYSDIVLCSAHCDFGGRDLGIQSFASLLSREQRGDARTQEEIIKLHSTRRQLVSRLMNPYPRRLGRRSPRRRYDNQAAPRQPVA